MPVATSAVAQAGLALHRLAKRYALCSIDDHGDPLLVQDDKLSKHGLGHFLNPADSGSDGQAWIKDLWRMIILKAHGRNTETPEWISRPTMVRTTITSPAVLRAFRRLNDGRTYAEGMKPLNFVMSVAGAKPPVGVPMGDPSRLEGPFESDPRKWEGHNYRLHHIRSAASLEPTDASIALSQAGSKYGLRMAKGEFEPSERMDTINEDEPGAEDENDLSSLGIEDFIPVRVTAVDWTVGTLLDQIADNNIDIAPRFQRRDVWSPSKKSRLVESIVLGIPVPQIILATLPPSSASSARLTVIDGRQRLLAISAFMRPELIGSSPLMLTGLNVLRDLNGSTFESMQNCSGFEDALFALRTRTIRTVLVENAPNDRVLHLIFLRLNTETVRLSPQELRQAEFAGGFTTWLDKASAEADWLHKAIRVEGPDFRMRDMEVLLRFFAFRRFLDDYSGNIKVFLDETSTRLNSQLRQGDISISLLEDLLQEEEEAVEATFAIFGKDAFTSLGPDGFENRFNRAVYDVMVYFFSDSAIATAAIAKADEVQRAYIALGSHPSFTRWTQSTTKSKEATFGRLLAWGEQLQRVLSIPVMEIRPIPS